MLKKSIESDINKKCVICNKSYNYHYDLFGRGCLSNLYTQLNIGDHSFISNKEKYLCDRIAIRNFKPFLNKNKKYALAQNYIALDYLKKMDLKSTKGIQFELNENIKNISSLKKYNEALLPKYPLNDFYKIYNDYVEFEKLLVNIKKMNGANIDETILKGFSIVFDAHKNMFPLYHAAFYDMQYMFWKTVVMGGLLSNMKLSAYLLQISLNNSGEYEKKNNRLKIEDEYVNNILFKNNEFKEKIDNLLKMKNKKITNKYIEFIRGDLMLALHYVVLNMNAVKNKDNSFDLDIEIMDKYDFTEIKKLKDYIDSSDSITVSLVSSTLNNFAAISSAYGVIKPFNFIIKIKKKNYVVGYKK